MTARGAIENSRFVGVIKGEEVRDNPIKYFLPPGVGSNFCVQEDVMAVLLHHRVSRPR